MVRDSSSPNADMYAVPSVGRKSSLYTVRPSFLTKQITLCVLMLIFDTMLLYKHFNTLVLISLNA